MRVPDDGAPQHWHLDDGEGETSPSQEVICQHHISFLLWHLVVGTSLPYVMRLNGLTLCIFYNKLVLYTLAYVTTELQESHC